MIKGGIMKRNKSVKKELMELYKNKCMLTLLETKITFHHIKKRQYGGKKILENGGLVEYRLHQWLHNEIELHDRELYQLINECLVLYKMCYEQGKEQLLEQYEKEVAPEYIKIKEKKENGNNRNKY
jgi:hypothetical protein